MSFTADELGVIDKFFDSLYNKPRKWVQTPHYNFTVDGDGFLRIYGSRRNLCLELMTEFEGRLQAIFPSFRLKETRIKNLFNLCYEYKGKHGSKTYQLNLNQVKEYLDRLRNGFVGKHNE